MALIQKREKKNGKTTYTALIRVKGHPAMSATFERLTDARSWAAEIEAQMKRGKHIKDVEAKKHTLNELIERYIKTELPERKSDHKKFEMQLRWWQDKIGAYMLSDVTPALLSKSKEDLATEPSAKPKNGRTTRTNATVNRYMACLSIVFTFAVKEWGWMEENPMLKVTKKKEPKGRIRFLSEDERKILLTECQKVSKELYLAVLIAISTGARYGEILGLKWENIDFENRLFHFIDTKNGENRGVPISSMVLKELQAFSKVRNIKFDLVFISPDGQYVYNAKDRFTEVVKAAKIENFKFHDLRHTAASYLAMNGASLLDIAEILGHKTLAMVKRYSHLTKKHTAAILENMNNAMLQDIGG